MPSRRQFLATSAAAAGVTVLPFAAQSAAHAGDSFANGTITVHPVSHASFVMQTPMAPSTLIRSVTFLAMMGCRLPI